MHLKYLTPQFFTHSHAKKTFVADLVVIWQYKNSEFDHRFASLRQAALQLFNQMLELEYSPDKITYTATISTCTDCIQWPQALALLHFAEFSQLQLDVIPYNATITACEKASRWNQAMVLLSTIDNKPDLQADSISFTATRLKGKLISLVKKKRFC